MYHKLLLVYAPPEERTSSLYSEGWCIPTGILSIATYAAHHNFEVSILDGTVLELADIKEHLSYTDEKTIVGFSTTVLNLKQSAALAQIAKEQGATTIFGGPQATHLGYNVLNELSYVDYIIAGEGEVPVMKLLQEERLSGIENLIYRDGETIRSNPVSNSEVWKKYAPDRSLLTKIEQYKQNWHTQNSDKLFTATNVCYQRGCSLGTCNFCAEQNGATNGSLNLYFNHLRELQADHGFNAFFEVSPGPSSKTLECLLQNRPPDLSKTYFRFYTSPHILTDKTINVLKELNTWEVFIGVESGDIGVLRKSRAVKVNAEKMHSTGEKLVPDSYHHRLEEAVGKLSRVGIQVKVSFIMGLESETEKSLDHTLSYATRLVQAGATSLACSVLLPLPGTKVFHQILQHPTLESKYRARVFFDLDELRSDWITHFCYASLSEITIMQQKTLDLLPNSTAIGRIK